MCAHADDQRKWNHMTASLVNHLWLPPADKKEAVLVHPASANAREERFLTSEYAQALNDAFSNEHGAWMNNDPLTPLLSAQTLLALGSPMTHPHLVNITRVTSV